MDFKFGIIGLSETWQSNKTSIVTHELPGYYLFEFICGKTQNSGCGFYIKNNLKYQICEDLSSVNHRNNEEFEVLFIEIFYDTEKILVGVTYRHPIGRESVVFTSHVDNLLQSVQKENKKIIIMGDFNINLLNFESHSNTNSFLDVMLENCLQPHIIPPTKFNDNQKYALIDNIFSNDIINHCTSGNLTAHISDHLPNFLIINNVKTCRISKTKLLRDFSQFDIHLFMADLRKVKLHDKLKNMPDVNVMFNFFHSALSTLFDMHDNLTKVQQNKNKSPG